MGENIMNQFGGKSTGDSRYLKSGDFDGGKELRVVSVEKITAKDADYGAGSIDWLFKEGILAAGETFRYSFLDDEGNEKMYDTKGTSFYFAFKDANVEADDKVNISKTGSGKTTKYEISKVE